MRILLPIILTYFLISSLCNGQQRIPQELSRSLSAENRRIGEEYITEANGIRYKLNYVKTASYNERTQTMKYIVDSLIYDSEGLLAEAYYFDFNWGTRVLYQYDSRRRPIQKEYQDWNGNLWKKRTRLEYKYDNRENIISSKQCEYDEEKGWQEFYLGYHIYDGLGRIIQKDFYALSYYPTHDISYFSYNIAGLLIRENGEWENGTGLHPSYNMELTYDKSNKLIDSIYQTGWNGSFWEDDKRAKFKYNDDGFLISRTRYFIKNGIEERFGDSLSLYYDENNRIIFTLLDDPGIYSESAKYEYNENGKISAFESRYWGIDPDSFNIRIEYIYEADNISSITKYNWSYEHNEWSLYNKAVYSYNSDGNCDQIRLLSYADGNWVPSRINDVLINPGRGYSSYGVSVDMRYTKAPEIKEYFRPDELKLAQNYPNPFNPETVISFNLPQSGKATLKIYDLLGREVAVLLDGEAEYGIHTYTFSGRNLASGVYIYRLQSGAFTECKKMMLMK